MSKLESGEIVLEEIPFNLGSISREVFVVIEQMAAEQNIQIEWEKKEITHQDFIGSPGYVKRVMMNILSNAVKYNRENGHIYISGMEIPSEQPEMTTIEFVCRDTGIGMTDEFQKCVFEPFAQEHTGSRTKFAGTGLGMSIAKNLVEKMGGSISFESEEGAGTTFVIRVPFKIDPDADKREEQRDVSEKSIKGLHILLAEDNELNMEIAEFVLQNGGADVTKARNGQEAVELFRKSASGEFDAILMDIMMPVMNGYEAAKKIRSLDREDAKTIPIIAMTANAFMEDRLKAKEAGMNEHIVILDVMLPDGDGFSLCRKIKADDIAPVIFLTAKDEEKDVVMGLELGADDYVIKPFRNMELLSRIKNVLRRNRSGNELTYAGLKMNVDIRKLYKEDNEIKLTKLEFEILKILLQNPKKVFTREEILSHIWDSAGNFVNDNTLTVTIKRLREKIGDKEGNIIVTVRGVGYRLSD